MNVTTRAKNFGIVSPEKRAVRTFKSTRYGLSARDDEPQVRCRR